MEKLLWIFFIGICFAQSGQNFLKKTEVGDSINAHLTNYADKPEMMDSILANAGTVSGLPDTALTLRQVIIDSSSAIRADMGNASVNYIDSVANLKLDKTALKDSIDSRNLVYEPELDDSISSVRQVIIDSTSSVTQNLADSMNTIMMLSEVIDSMKAAIADTLKSTYIVPSNVNGNLSISASTSLNMTSVDIKVFGNIEFNNTVSFFDTLEIPFGIKLGSFPSTDGIIKNTMSNRVSKFYGGSLTNSGAMFLYGQSHSTKPKFIELLTGNTVRQSISGTGIVSFTSDTVKNSGVFRNTGFVNSVAGYLFNGTNINTKNTLTNVAYKDSTNTFTQTQKATVFNATSGFQLNGTSINTTGTLSNVAYKGQDNGFTTSQTITGNAVELNVLATGGNPFINLSRKIGGAAARYKFQTDGVDEVEMGLLGGQTNKLFILDGSVNQKFSFDVGTGFFKIGTGVGAEALDVTGNIIASGTVTAPTLNGTTAIQLNGTSINTTGTLTNVAYKGQNNNFTVGQTITGNTLITGTLSVTSNFTLSTSGGTGQILGNTNDGADNGRLNITATTNPDVSRGGYFSVMGNEHAAPGYIILSSGNVTGSAVSIRHKNTARILINDDDNTNVTGNIKVSADIYNSGDTYWTGDGSGIPYGSCYGNEIAWSQASAAQDTYYNISDADMTDGSGGLNLVTHDGSGKITVTKAGRYMITYSVAGSCNAVDKHIKTGIEINGSGTIVGDGQDHNISNAVDTNIPLGSCAILDLAANDTIEISIGTTDTGTPTIAVDHLNIVVTMVGGT